MRFGYTAAAVLATVAIAGAAAVPAHSTVRERWHFTNEPYAFTFDDCGFEIAVEGTFSDLAIVREGKGDDAGAFPVISRFAFQDRYTNTATGEWFTIRSRDTFVEIRATRVEGSIFEFRFVEAGQPWVIRNSDGELVARNRGAVHGTYLFDTGGDDQPGGEYVEDGDVVLKVAGPHPSFEQDFCEIASDLIG